MVNTLQELLDQRAKLDHQIAELKNGARRDAILSVKALMAEHGLTMADFATANASGRQALGVLKGSKVAAKYRDRETGATWTGRGLKPRWLAAAIAAGRKIEDFAI